MINSHSIIWGSYNCRFESISQTNPTDKTPDKTDITSRYPCSFQTNRKQLSNANKLYFKIKRIYIIFTLYSFLNRFRSVQCRNATKAQVVTGCGRIRKRNINNEREEIRVIMRTVDRLILHLKFSD